MKGRPMRSKVFQYQFTNDVPLEEIESSLLLSVISVESLHGETEVQLNATHDFDLQRRICIIDAGTEVGRDLNRIFAGFLRREFGAKSFRVRHITTPAGFPSGS